MISINSIKKFFYVNSLLFGLGFIQYKIINAYENIYSTFFIILATFLSRNVFLIKFIDDNLQNKENINNRPIFEEYNNQFNLAVLSTTIIETITYIFIKHFIFGNIIVSNNYYTDILYFIPITFIFELIFDFFHYWTHRISHANKYLYIYSHKSHHKFKHPISILTFYHNPLDLIITNCIPLVLSLIIFPYLTLFQFNIFLFYKTFIEISGHCGKKIYPNGSFSQFIWLPKFLNITLYSEDHNLHHAKNTCNYSKRFSLWDKLFGTYESIVTKKLNIVKKN